MPESRLPAPDFERARQYVLEKLEGAWPAALYYHSVAHTQQDVVPAAERLAALAGVDGEDLLLLRTAAYFHDLGYVEQYWENETIGARMARDVLPRWGYTPAHVQVIAGLILATRLPQRPHNRLEEILADSDLDNLGRDDFWEKSAALRLELEAQGRPVPLAEWYLRQWRFLQAHRYFTPEARALRGAGQQKNLAWLAARLAQEQDPPP